MLGKLLKHELKATARWFLPLYLIAIVMSIVTRITMPLGHIDNAFFQFIPGLITFAYVVVLLMVGAASVILMIFRFYKSMVTEEGYLTHTLPVSVGSLLWSKLLVAALWSFASIVVIILAIVILVFTPEGFAEFWHELNYYGLRLIEEYITKGQLTILITELFILMIVALLTAPLTYYTSIAIGQIISKNKIAGAVVGFFIISIAGNIIGTVLMIPFGFAVNDTMNAMDALNATLKVMMPAAIVVSLGSGAILYFITYYVFKNKLNLE